jgi:hypothetical protein
VAMKNEVGLRLNKDSLASLSIRSSTHSLRNDSPMSTHVNHDNDFIAEHLQMKLQRFQATFGIVSRDGVKRIC